MKILVIADGYPMPDKASGDLRFFHILSILSQIGDVCYYPLNIGEQLLDIGECEVKRYRHNLEFLGVRFIEGSILDVIKAITYDCVFYEFYYTANAAIQKIVRIWQPNAWQIIDSVDIHFRRLEGKAGVTGSVQDLQEARIVKENELLAYAGADIVIAVSEHDKTSLTDVSPGLNIAVIPNIHTIYIPEATEKRKYGLLVFVGGFHHEPNVDAMIYFCNEIMPILVREIPSVRLQIIGSSPPDLIKQLASEHVEVVGFVTDTKPYLQKAYISVAPLRFGAGMKGKVGEALSLGLPVVTTSIGIEGFGLTPGENVLVGDTAQSFAKGVVSLLNDPTRCHEIGLNGWQFISDHYSEGAVKNNVLQLFGRLSNTPPNKISFFRRMLEKIYHELDRRIMWRLR